MISVREERLLDDTNAANQAKVFLRTVQNCTLSLIDKYIQHVFRVGHSEKAELYLLSCKRLVIHPLAGQFINCILSSTDGNCQLPRTGLFHHQLLYVFMHDVLNTKLIHLLVWFCKYTSFGKKL